MGTKTEERDKYKRREKEREKEWEKASAGATRNISRWSRASNSLFIAGVLCIVWQLGRWMGSRDAADFISADYARREGVVDGEANVAIASAEGYRPTASGDDVDGSNAALDAEKGHGMFSSGRFWETYAAERHAMLSGGGDEARHVGGSGSPIKFLVFTPTDAGLGNHMAGIMSAFVLSLATRRVFLHDWNAPTLQCAAGYNELFIPPFRPWSTANAVAGEVSGPGEIFGECGQQHLCEEDGAGAGTWEGAQEVSSDQERSRCSLDLTQKGVESGVLNSVFVDSRGQDPKPDCRVLFLRTNQYLVELLTSPAYGSPRVGGVLLSEWLPVQRAVQTLFAGLFRPLKSVQRRVEDTTTQLFPVKGQTMAAHARAHHLGGGGGIEREKFVQCLKHWAQQRNVTTVVLATDIPEFVKDTATKLRPNGIAVKALEGVRRTGEGVAMRNTVAKIHEALIELLLVGQADIVVTSPRSSFSALAAAYGGEATQRIGSMSCMRVTNVPEFHLLDCGMAWELDAEKWGRIYSFTADNRERCSS